MESSPAANGRARRPTMRDVAARVGVSQALVSLVFRSAPGASEETRERVFRAAAELGYRPDASAQVLRSARSRRLGVLFSMQQPYEVDLVEAIYPAAQRNGYGVALGALVAGRDERTAVEELLSSRTEAIILIAPTGNRKELTELARQLPIVEIGRRLRGGAEGIDHRAVDSVRSADDRGAQMAVDHLVALGHRDIVHIDGGSQPGAADRRRGYRAAMRRHGLADHIRVLPGDYTEESGADAARALLDEERLPTGVFAANDRCAHGLLYTLVRAGVAVPRQVSIVGYDDSRIARLSYIDLTSVRQDAAEMADLAVAAAVERLDQGRTTPKDLVIQPTLVVRGSSGPREPTS
jgi:DNA-binding LacI/PurR family transcriptional regulator